MITSINVSGSGSLTNSMMGQGVQPTPEVGMGCTRLLYSDRRAGTIVEIASKRRIGIRMDGSKRIDSNGESEDQAYDFYPTEGPAQYYYTLRKNGKWIREGEPLRGGEVLRIGKRDEYYDYTR